MKTFIFFNSARLQCEAVLAKIQLLYVQNVVERVVLVIFKICFFPQKAMKHSCPAKLILDISEE